MIGIRSKSLADIVIADAKSDYIVRNIANGKIAFPVGGKNGFLFHGPFGTGKTTLAKLLPVEIEHLYGNPPPPSDFFAADIDDKINRAHLTNMKKAAALVCLDSQFQHFIIDECDNLNRRHQTALRGIMDASGSRSIFYFTTNKLNQIDGGVASRCHIIDCSVAPPQAWLPLVTCVLQNNGAMVPGNKVLLRLIYNCNGSVREIISEAHRFAAHLIANGHVVQSTSTPLVPVVPAVMNGARHATTAPQTP